MITKQPTVSETKALGILGHAGRKDRDALRLNVPHTLTHIYRRNERWCRRRHYLTEAVVEYRHAKGEAWRKEIAELKARIKAERESNASNPGGTSKVYIY